MFQYNKQLDLSSDHSPLIIEVNNKVGTKMQLCTLHNKQTNWHVFREQVNTLTKHPNIIKETK